MKVHFTTFAALVAAVTAFHCPPPGNVFPVPLEISQDVLHRIAASVKEAIDGIGATPSNITAIPVPGEQPPAPPADDSTGDSSEIGFGNSTISVELTSPSASFYSFHHVGPLTANSTQTVDGDSAYRIGSVSKVFSTLTMLLADLDEDSGVRMDDSIVKYFPELKDEIRGDGVQWDRVTLRALASHLGGLDREAGSLDLIAFLPDFDYTLLGLPPLPEDRSELMCGTGHGSPECTDATIISFLKQSDHDYAQPMDRATYSNAGFGLLGMAMAKNAKTDFGTVLESRIFSKLNMTRSSVVPPDTNGVIPDIPGGDTQWADLLGPQDGAGGLYSSVSDLSWFIRGITTARIMPQVEINRWLKPVSFTGSLDTAYGMPWEIYRFQNATASQRTVDVYTKNGALGAYNSKIFILPDFGFGGAVLGAGDPATGALVEEIATAAAKAMYDGLEEASRAYARDAYAGSYSSAGDYSNLNSSIVLEVDDDQPGIKVTSWISNGTDIFVGLKTLGPQGGNLEFRLFPTARNDVPESPSDTVQFRGILGSSADDKEPSTGCFTDNAVIYYAGKPINEMKFKLEDGAVTGVELPAFKVTLKKNK